VGFAPRPFVRGLLSPAVERDCVAMVCAGSALPVQEGRERQAGPVLASDVFLAPTSADVLMQVASAALGLVTRASR